MKMIEVGLKNLKVLEDSWMWDTIRISRYILVYYFSPGIHTFVQKRLALDTSTSEGNKYTRTPKVPCRTNRCTLIYTGSLCQPYTGILWHCSSLKVCSHVRNSEAGQYLVTHPCAQAVLLVTQCLVRGRRLWYKRQITLIIHTGVFKIRVALKIGCATLGTEIPARL